MFVILINGGLWEGGKVFKSVEEIEKEFRNCGVSEWIEEGDVVGFDVGMKKMLDGGCEWENDELLEYGDDFVSIEICELNV